MLEILKSDSNIISEEHASFDNRLKIKIVQY